MQCADLRKKNSRSSGSAMGHFADNTDAILFLLKLLIPAHRVYDSRSGKVYAVLYKKVIVVITESMLHRLYDTG